MVIILSCSCSAKSRTKTPKAILKENRDIHSQTLHKPRLFKKRLKQDLNCMMAVTLESLVESPVTLSESKVQVQCGKRDKCKETVCEECTSNHSHHKLNSIELKENTILQLKLSESIMKGNRQSSCRLIERIEKEIIKLNRIGSA